MICPLPRALRILFASTSHLQRSNSAAVYGFFFRNPFGHIGDRPVSLVAPHTSQSVGRLSLYPYRYVPVSSLFRKSGGGRFAGVSSVFTRAPVASACGSVQDAPVEIVRCRTTPRRSSARWRSGTSGP